MDHEGDTPILQNDPVTIGGASYAAETVTRLLEPFVSEDRRGRIDTVVEGRTRSIVPVIEGVHDLGNIGAVTRSAEGLGYQELHIVDRGDVFKQSRRTSQGTEKWIDLVRWSDSTACVSHLKDRGYRVLVTHLEAASPIDSFDFTRPTAIVFGNEAEGISDEMLSLADERCCIPMLGFAQSFNISVAVAIALYHAFRQRTDRLGAHGDLSSSEKNTLRALYYSRSVQASDQILKRLGTKRK